MKCTKRRTDGEPCRKRAIAGTDSCESHCGIDADTHKAKGEVVVTLRRWGIDDIPEDPNLLALKLMSVTEWRRQDYEAEMLRIAAESGLPLSEALVGDSIVVDKDGSPHKVGEYIRGIVDQEFRERKLAAELTFKVLNANVQERLTRVQEQTVELLASALLAVLGDLESLRLAGRLRSLAPSDEDVQRVLSERLAPLAVSA